MMYRKRQEGSILLLSVLVMIVMIAMGLMAVQNVTMDMNSAGTYRVGKQGYYVTEAGLTGPIAMAAKDQNGFNSYLENKEDNQYVVFMNDINSNFYDFSTWGSFGPEFSQPNAASFRASFTDPVDTHRVPGFSTGEFCFRRYTVIAEGMLSADGLADPDDPDSVRHMAQARFMSNLYMGPFQCGL